MGTVTLALDARAALEQVIGWQGITLDVPADWGIGALSGDRAGGYLRIDDPVRPRLEVRWQNGSGGESKKVLERYFRGMEHAARKARERLVTHSGVKLLRKARKDRADVMGYSWQQEARRGYGVIWSCKTCRRIVLTQLTGEANEPLAPLAQRLFESIEDHGEGGWDTWNVYGFKFEMPDRFRLERQRLLTGHLELEFRRGARDRIILMRWARGRAVLGSHTLEEWMKSALLAFLSQKRFGVEKAKIVGHAALRVVQPPPALLPRLRDRAMHVMLQQEPAIRTGFGWHCPSEDKVFVIGCSLRGSHSFLAREIAESVVCHER